MFRCRFKSHSICPAKMAYSSSGPSTRFTRCGHRRRGLIRRRGRACEIHRALRPCKYRRMGTSSGQPQTRSAVSRKRNIGAVDPCPPPAIVVHTGGSRHAMQTHPVQTHPVTDGPPTVLLADGVRNVSVWMGDDTSTDLAFQLLKHRSWRMRNTGHGGRCAGCDQAGGQTNQQIPHVAPGTEISLRPALRGAGVDTPTGAR